MTRKSLRLLAYVRVSDVRGREGPGFISPDEQREKCRAFATAIGHNIIDIGEELDRSGGDMSRPIFNSFLERIEAGEADGIIVAKLNRFARSNVGAWQALERITDAGGELLSVEENVDTSTATGRFLRDFMLIAANWERERIGEQWLSARTRAVRRGIHVSRHVPPGYKRLPRSTNADTDRRLVPDEKHAATIEQAFRMAADGASYSRIAAYLTDRKLPIGGNGDSTWQGNRIRRLLENRAYLGEARSGTGIVNTDAHDPLVDPVTFQLAQGVASEPRAAGSASALLAGLCRCASCSFSMRSQQARGGAVGVYRCSTQSVHGRCPSPTTISRLPLERFVLDSFLARAGEAALEVVTDSADDELLVAVQEKERSYQSVLLDTDLRLRIGDADHTQLVLKLHDEWQELLTEAASARRSTPAFDSAKITELVDELQGRGDINALRELLSSAVQAVFVRPAASRARHLPVGDRAHVVWRGEERLRLPRRGERFTPRPYKW